MGESSIAHEIWVHDLGNVTFSVAATWAPLSGTANGELTQAGRLIQGATAIDFGQGDCNAIQIGTNAGALVGTAIYFDIGGGSGCCSHTHPHHPNHGTVGARGWHNVPPRLDVALDPTVILSHWDKDHYYSAKKAAAETKDLQWLVPRQKIGPQCAKFVRTLTDIGCFPTGSPARRFRLSNQANSVDLFVEQATDHGSSDRNLNGLSCTLVRHDGAGTDLDRIIMPADAPYNLLPSLSGGPSPGGDVVGLFAYHHGSRTHLDDAIGSIPPPPAAPAVHAIGFSYGLKADNTNPYNHPNRDATDAYRGQNWATRVNTASNAPADLNTATTGSAVATRGNRNVFFP